MYDSVEDLRSVLQKIEQAIGGAASKAPRAQILKTIGFLDQHIGKSIGGLLTELEAAKPQPKPKIAKSAPSKPRATKPKEPVRTLIVQNYVQKLKSAEGSLEEFAALLAAIKADKAVRVDEMKAIVPEYTGDTSSIKSKPTGLGVIQRAFDVRWTLRQHSEQNSTAQ